MRISFLVAACMAPLILVGCAGTKSTGGKTKPAPIVTPDSSLIGKVAFVNRSSRYVVLHLPARRAPTAGQVLNVFRDGVKVGELKVNALQQGDNVVADITAGEAQVGDQVRER